jgi:hypothetical protein
VVDEAATATFGAAEYLAFLEGEYLTSYVGRGGAAVKLVATGDEDGVTSLAAGLPTLGEGFAHVSVDSVTTRIHLIDQVFAEAARQVDWTALAGAVLAQAYAEIGFPPAGPEQLAVSAVARQHEVDAAELVRSLRRELERRVLRDAGLSHEFRTAMFRLCQYRMGRGDVSRPECESVIGWLRLERVPIGELRKLGLAAKVGRHNARAMLLSLTRWLRLAGYRGTVLHLDLARLAVARRPPAGLRDGYYYSKAAVLDAYELIRQLIDATDEFEGLLAAVTLPRELVHDETRGLPAYSALRLRVIDEVRDRYRVNPYSTLVPVGASMEQPA